MTSAQDFEALKKLGVSPDYALHRIIFQSCPGCAQYFTESFLPILLACGHFICKNCIKDQIYKHHLTGKMTCLGPNCKKQMVQKQKQFRKVLQLSRQGTVNANSGQSNQKVDFVVRTETGLNDRIKGISINVTFEQLLGQHMSLLQQVYSKIGTGIQELQFVINSKAFLYKQVKNLKVKDKVNLWNTEAKSMNQLFLYDRKLGGML